MAESTRIHCASRWQQSKRLLPIFQDQIQGSFEDFQGIFKETTLTQNGTFISIYKQVQSKFNILSANLTKCSMKLLNNELKSGYSNSSLDCLSDMTQDRTEPVFLFTQGVLENQIQGLSRTFIHRFKDFQGRARALKVTIGHTASFLI